MPSTAAPPPDASAALGRLERVLAGSAGMLVAYSGGVDSAVLAVGAHRALGGRAVAFTADSPSLPRRELRRAAAVLASAGVPHVVRATGEMDREAYRRNDRDRCYWCKDTLFDACARAASELGLDEIAYGYTADDVGEHRPGHRAASERHVRSPLHEAGLRKPEIREVARHLGLAVWDKPAAPCLSSRVPFGSVVTADRLARIEAMEDLLDAMGFRLFRARYDGQAMRIEVGAEEIPRATAEPARGRMVAEAERLGIARLTVDLEGFRSGKLTTAADPAVLVLR
jgi:uncharacterized protein